MYYLFDSIWGAGKAAVISIAVAMLAAVHLVVLVARAPGLIVTVLSIVFVGVLVVVLR